MVVRLSDLKSDSTPSKSKLVRLDDINKQEEAVATQKLSDSYHSSPVSHNQFDNLDIRQSPTLQNITKPNSMPVADVAPISNYEDRKNDPSRKIPVLGSVFKLLDKLSDTKTQHVIADVGQTFYTPGAGAANVAGLFGGVEKGIAKVAPNLVSNAAGRIAQKVTTGAATGFPLGVGGSLAQGQDGKQAIEGGVYGSLLGGGFGALGGSIGELASQIKKDRLSATFDKMFPAYEQAAKNRNVQPFTKAKQFTELPTLGLPEPKSAIMAREAQKRSVLPANTDVIRGRGNVETLGLPESPQYNAIQRIKAQQTLGLPEANPNTVAEFNRRNGNVQPTNTNPIYGHGNVADPLGLPQGDYVKPTRLKVNNPNETLDYVMTKIKPEVMDIIEAPARRDLLVQYVQKNMQMPLNEIHNMPMKDLQDLGQQIQDKLHGNMQQIAFDVAKQHGHDLPSLLENQAPSLRDQMAKDAQSRVYGVPAENVNIPRPKFNKEVTGQAAAPKQGLAFKREPKVQESNQFVETPLQKQQRYAKQIKDAEDKKKISELSKPIIGRAAMPETKIGRPSSLREVAATTEVKPRVAPIKGTITKNETVKPTLKENAAKTDPIIVKPKVEVIGKAEPLKVRPTITPTQRVSGIRANYQNQLKNGNLSPELKDMIKNTDQSYEKITNKASDEVAQAAVKNLPKAESDFLLNQTGGPDHIATGYRLQQKLDAMGEHSRALVVSNKLAKDLTKSGQTQQAASIISRLSPEGQLLNLIRTAEKNGKTVSVADSVEFKAQARKAKEKAGAGVQANQFTEILDRAAKGEKLTPEDVKKMGDYLASVEKNSTKTKSVKVVDDLPNELKEPRKRDRIVSYLDDAEQAALARIKARKNNLNSLPIGEWADHAIVAASQITKGSIKAATHVEDLVKLFGEEIRPVATQVFQKAQSLVKRVSPSVGEGDLTKANQAFRRLSGAAEQEKAVVQEMAMHVKKLIADAKAGKLDTEGIQKLRDYADEIANMTEDLKPRELPTQDQRFLQSVKLLSKKIAQAETEKIPMDQANKDISNILRQITKISEEGTEQALKMKVDNTHLSDIAHDVMNKTRPTPKPTTLQEKIVEKYVKQQEKLKNPVSPKDIETLRELAKNVTRMSGDDKVSADIAMQKILNSYEKSTPWDKVNAVRYIAMLLNDATQAVNAASGPIMATLGHTADVFGVMVDSAMHHVLKTPRSTTLYGTNPLRFMADYFKHLVKTGAPAGWHGVNPGGIQNAGEIRGLTYKSNYNPLNWAERALGAVAKGTDYATYKTVFDSEMRKKGFIDAIDTGIKRSDKPAIKAHIEKFINEPPSEAVLDADRIGRNTTFQRSDSTGGKVANFLASGPAITKPIIGAITPFVKTPINMASSAVSMTPAGILKGLWQLTSKSKASQREAIRTLSLGVTGTFGTSALGYYLSNIGIITGANDSGDKNVDAIREQAGQGKYRFNTSALKRYMHAWLSGEGADGAEKAAKYQEGDHAFDYNKFQPIAFPLAIGASLGKTEGKPMLGRLEGAGLDAYGSLFGMSTLKGVQDVFQPQYSGTQGEKSIGVASRIAESFFKSFSPSMLAQEARRQDSNVRKTPYNNGIVEDVKGYFKSRTPGLSQSLPASKTTLGMNKMNAAGFSGQYANPYKSEIAAYSSAAVIISDLIDKTGDTSLAPSAPVKNVKFKNKAGDEVTLAIPQDRYEQLQEELGHEIILKITAMDPKLSDTKKADKIKDIYTKARKKEMDKVEKELKAAQ